jgi:hypothetical protein
MAPALTGTGKAACACEGFGVSVWGAVPVLAVALIGPAAGTQLAPPHGPAGRLSAVSVVADQEPGRTAGAPVQTIPSPVLQQLADGGWQATVAMAGTGGAPCPGGASAAASFTLETTSPAVTETAIGATPATKATTYPCELTVTFGPFGSIPASAALLYLGASPISLTVSRQVTAFDYLGLPAIGGAAAVALLLLGCLCFVQVYGEDGRRERKLARRLKAPVRATGAWTLNDSWATNIATLVAIVATVLGVSPAAGELFPGADIGKFVVLIDSIGAIATAVPLLFAVLYTSWTAREPGLSEDASLWLTATLGHAAAACLLDSAGFSPARRRRGAGGVRSLQAGDEVLLARGSRVMIAGAGPVALAREVTDVTLMPGTVVALRAGTTVSYPQAHPARLSLPTKARLQAPTVVTLPPGTVVTPPVAGLTELVTLPPGQDLCLPPGTAVTWPSHATATVTDAVPAGLPDGAAARIAPEARIAPAKEAELTVTLPDKTPVTLVRAAGADLDADPAGAGTIAGPRGVRARLVREPDPDDPEPLRLDSISFGPGADLRVNSGATITLPWGASASSAVIGDGATQPVRVEAGSAIAVPPGGQIRVYGGYMTVPGSSDILLRGDCVLAVDNESGTLAVAPCAGETAEGEPGTGTAALGFPVRITVHSGARISVTGVARLNVPESVTVTAPRRRTFSLSAASSRTPIRVPQGTSTLVGPL